MINISNNRIYNTYNLTIAGLCDAERLENFVNYFKNEIYNTFKEHTNFYKTESLEAMESDPKLLKKTSKMAIGVSNNSFTESFIGFSSNKSIEEIYEILFGCRSKFNSVFSNKRTPYFSKKYLMQLLQDNFGGTNVSSFIFDYDITVDFKCKPLPDSKKYVEIKCSVSPIFKLPFNTVECFIDITERGILHFTDELHSAYISYSPSHLSVTHASMYQIYDCSRLSDHILGEEWYVYMCKQIKDAFCPNMIKAISKYAYINTYKNGISYKANSEIFDFDKYRNYYHTLFYDLLIPGYVSIGWNELCNSEEKFSIHPTSVYVFGRGFDPSGPDIIMAHNCSINEVCRYDVITKEDLIFSLHINQGTVRDH